MRPMGLNKIMQQVEKIVANKTLYTAGGVALPWFLIDMPAHSGRSFLGEYLADLFMEEGLLKRGDPDRFAEYRIKEKTEEIR